MPKIALSVILITKNEAHNIVDCLASVGFADEWIVVDSGSTDATRDLAAAFGATVVHTTDWPGFGPQKARALALARGEWVLSIDADERVDDALAAQIRRVVSGGHDDAAVAYELSRLSRFCGQWIRHGSWYPDRVLRLFQRDHGRFSDDRVHERVLVTGRTGRLSGLLLHETMTNLHDALDKLNLYSSGRAADLRTAGRQGGLGSALGHGVWAFLRSYVLKRGFLDGRLGFVLAVYIAEGTYYRYLKLAWPAKPEAAK